MKVGVSKKIERDEADKPGVGAELEPVLLEPVAEVEPAAVCESVEVVDVVEPEDVGLCGVEGGGALMELCRRRVVYGGRSLVEVREEYGVSQQKMRAWSEAGQWEKERRVLRGRDEDKLKEAMEIFARSREMPLLSGYYDLQEAALERLRTMLSSDKLTASQVESILVVAQKGMEMGERVINRANPKRVKQILEESGGGVGANGVMNVPSGGSVNVNVLGALVSDHKRKVDG